MAFYIAMSFYMHKIELNALTPPNQVVQVEITPAAFELSFSVCVVLSTKARLPPIFQRQMGTNTYTFSQKVD